MRSMGFTISESANNYPRNSKHRMKAYELKLEKQAIENILNLPKFLPLIGKVTAKMNHCNEFTALRGNRKRH